MRSRLRYAIFTGLLIGGLGGLAFFIWDLINHSFSVSHAINSVLPVFIIFVILGFILGLLIGDLE
ncbi:MAG TPA: hypothetical protein VF324_09700 [Methanobacterium sp.]